MYLFPFKSFVKVNELIIYNGYVVLNWTDVLNQPLMEEHYFPTFMIVKNNTRMKIFTDISLHMLNYFLEIKP